MDDQYRECSVCSALLTDDEVWAEDSGSVVYTTSSLQIPMSKRGGRLVDHPIHLSQLDLDAVDPRGAQPRLPFSEGPTFSEISAMMRRAISAAEASMNGVLCEHCYVLQETPEFSGSYDFSDADELDPWTAFDE